MATTTPPPPPSKYSKICRLIAITLLILIILVGLIILIVWLTLNPKHLRYSIENGSIHHYNLTNNHLKADFHFTLKANNPNKKVSIYYDKIQTTAYFEDEIIAFNSINSFHQPRRNVTYLGFDLYAKDVSLSKDGVKDLRSERVRGKINVEIKVKCRVRFKVGKWKSRRRTMRLTCGPLTVPFSSSKKFQATSCDVDL